MYIRFGAINAYLSLRTLGTPDGWGSEDNPSQKMYFGGKNLEPKKKAPSPAMSPIASFLFFFSFSIDLTALARDGCPSRNQTPRGSASIPLDLSLPSTGRQTDSRPGSTPLFDAHTVQYEKDVSGETPLIDLDLHLS